MVKKLESIKKELAAKVVSTDKQTTIKGGCGCEDRRTPPPPRL